MLRRPNFLQVLILALVLAVLQTFALGHTAEHGCEEHDHDGVTCEIDVIASEDDAAVPAPPLELPAPPLGAAGLDHQVLAEGHAVRSAWPPPVRGPPSEDQ